jgi:amidase
LHYRGASEIAAGIASRDLNAGQVAHHTLDRIGDINPRLNAVVVVAEAELLSAAENFDRNDANGVLAGVPVTIKDAIDVAGLPNTWGNPEWERNIAATDAVVVTRLRAAGALIAGKTNVSLMLGDVEQTSNPLFGLTRNPWNLDRVTGGSSGGSAAAVAAGLSCVDIGSDLGGSIRIPAAMCGVYGFKPTPGIVPLDGFHAPGESTATLLDDVVALGPLARSAKDIRLALEVIAGPPAPAAAEYRWSLPEPRHRSLAEFRVGVVLDDPAAPVTSAVGSVLSNLVDDLSGRHVAITRGWPERFDARASQATFGDMIDAYLAFKFGQPGPDITLSDLSVRDQQRATLRALWQAYFTDVDVFLCPTAFTTAPPPDGRPIEQRTIPTATGPRNYNDLGFWIGHPSVAGLPAITAPVGLASDGLPVGLQIVAAPFDDDTAITFAELLSSEIGGYRPPPI